MRRLTTTVSTTPTTTPSPLTTTLPPPTTSPQSPTTQPSTNTSGMFGCSRIKLFVGTMCILFIAYLSISGLRNKSAMVEAKIISLNSSAKYSNNRTIEHKLILYRYSSMP